MPAGGTAAASEATPGASGGSPIAATSAGATTGSSLAGAFHVGQKAPGLVLPLLGGGTFDLARQAGKPVWVNFMATWCPPCRDEFPVMAGFAARYQSTGLVVVAVDVKEDSASIASFVSETGATFRVALDADAAAQQAWGAVALPVHFWVDAGGIVRDGALGGIGPDTMARGLQTILPGTTVTP